MTATKEQRVKRQAFCQLHRPLCKLLYEARHTVPFTIKLHRSRNGKLLVGLARKGLGFSHKYTDCDILTSLLKTHSQLLCQAHPKPQA